MSDTQPLTGHQQDPAHGVVLPPGVELVLEDAHFPLLIAFRDRRYIIRVSRYGSGLYMNAR